MSWPCGTGKKFVRAHARGEKLGLYCGDAGCALWEGLGSRAHARGGKLGFRVRVILWG